MRTFCAGVLFVSVLLLEINYQERKGWDTINSV